MGREFELKFRATAEQFAALKADYPDLQPIQMETTYYDTFDGKLSNYRWTFRRRMENGKSICTLKTPSENGGRSEWEVECDSIIRSVPLLCRAGAPWLLGEFTISGVGPVCGAKFTRLAGKIEAEGCVLELALDEGILTGGGRELPLQEVEVELKSGTDADAIAFAGILAEKYGLEPEEKSKYRRALGLARGK